MSKEMFKEVTKENQLMFVDDAIKKLQEFRNQVSNNELYIEDATFNHGMTAMTTEEAGSRNIYINIDYQESKPNIK